MPLIDVYDFDRTIFKHDTYTEFLRYACRRRPWLWPLLLFTLLGGLLMLLFPWDPRLGKRVSFIPMRLLRAPRMMDDFWAEMDRRGWIAPWFRPRENDVPVVICTASPRFMVEPLLKGMREVYCLVATELDPWTLRFYGRNNRGREKVRRLRRLFPHSQVRIACSDSIRHDRALLRIAKHPILVRSFERIALESV
jgi:hypothetical protein